MRRCEISTGWRIVSSDDAVLVDRVRLAASSPTEAVAALLHILASVDQGCRITAVTVELERTIPHAARVATTPRGVLPDPSSRKER